MVVVMDTDAPEGAIEAVVAHLTRAGCDVHRSSGQTRTLIGVVGSLSSGDAAVVAEMEGVAKVARISEPYRLASRRFRKQSSVVEGAWGAIGSDRPWIAVEAVGISGRASDADAPPPSLPYAVAAGGPFDAAITRASEGPDDLGALACLSLHARPIGAKWPVLFVTRDPSASLEAWIEVAEQELLRGANQVVLLEAGGACPGGPRTLDVAALTRVSALTHLPVVVDVPRIAGSKREVQAIAAAAIAAGVNGVILRAWAGSPGELPRVPGTLPWDAATAVAERLRAIGQAVRS
jgi:3-deoxy-7-phosphoheptulonate synthase